MQAMEEGNSSQQKAEEVVDIPDFRNVPLSYIKKLLSEPKFDDPEADMKKLQAATIATQLKKLGPKDRWYSFYNQMGEPHSGDALDVIAPTQQSPIQVMMVTKGATIGESKGVITYYGEGFEKRLISDIEYKSTEKCTFPVVSPSGKYICAWQKSGKLSLLTQAEAGETASIAPIPGTDTWKPIDVRIAFVDDTIVCIGMWGMGIYVGDVLSFARDGLAALTEIWGGDDRYHMLWEISTFAPGIIAAIAPDRKGLEFFCPKAEGKYIRQSIAHEHSSEGIYAVISNPCARFLAVHYQRDFAVFQLQNDTIVRVNLAIQKSEDVVKCTISPSGNYLACLITSMGGIYCVKVFDISKAPDTIYSTYVLGDEPGLVWTHSGIHCAQGDRITTFFFDSITPLLKKYDDRFNKNRGKKRENGDSGKVEKVSKFSE